MLFLDHGINWRDLSAADVVSVSFLWLKRQYRNDPEALRGLYELVGDKAAIAALDRAKMGQSESIETTM